MDIHHPVPHAVPSYQEFLETYLLPNKPVIIGKSLISSWPAFHKWASDEHQINWEYLKDAYGSCEVTVADCSTRDFSDQRREQMLLRDVISLWQEGKAQTLYVKDWHLFRRLSTAPEEFGQAKTDPFYSTPDIFRDDWMNAYYSAYTQDDFRFVYVGAEGTFTPLHRDVYTSYSWSTNVCGRKRWWLFPPEQTSLLFRKGGEEHLETAYDVRDVDPQMFPLFSQASPIIVEQGSGETIFVPSGWYHQVENLTACISINHNWCNAVNLPSLYKSMCAKVTEVEHALEDVKQLLSDSAAIASAVSSAPEMEAETAAPRSWEHEWVAIVQDVVEKDAGWNWLTFWRMLRHALTLALGRPWSDEGTLWPRTPPKLMPPLEFIRGRVRECYADFMCREQQEVKFVPILCEVLADVCAQLDDSR